jgi:hypothetical protein
LLLTYFMSLNNINFSLARSDLTKTYREEGTNYLRVERGLGEAPVSYSQKMSFSKTVLYRDLPFFMISGMKRE